MLAVHTHLVSSIVLLFSTIIHATSIAHVVVNNEALTKITDTVDAAVVNITALSGFAVAQQVPRNLHKLTVAIAATGFNDTRTSTVATLDPILEDTVTESYGLFTNTVEELMFDLYEKKNTLASYHQQHAIYREILLFNTTFVRYSSYMLGVVGDIVHQTLALEATGNAVTGILNATSIYAPDPAA